MKINKDHISTNINTFKMIFIKLLVFKDKLETKKYDRWWDRFIHWGDKLGFEYIDYKENEDGEIVGITFSYDEDYIKEVMNIGNEDET